MADVLVVDDEDAVREVLTRWLSAAGHAPREAEDAHAALEAMSKRAAAVVLCDVQMPGGPDGIWLTGELRQRFPMAAIVLATGVSTVPTRVSMQCGVLAYLLKPFNREAVLDAVAQGVAWHTETATRGPRPEDTSDRLAAWLEKIDTGRDP